MRMLFIVIAHLLVTLARLTRPGGVRAVAAESLAVKHAARKNYWYQRLHESTEFRPFLLRFAGSYPVGSS